MQSAQTKKCVSLLKDFIRTGWNEYFLHPPYDLTQALINPYADEWPTRPREWIDHMISLSKREQTRKVWIDSIKTIIELLAKEAYIDTKKKKRRSSQTYSILISYKGSVTIDIDDYVVERKFVAYITDSDWWHSYRLIIIFGDHEQLQSTFVKTTSHKTSIRDVLCAGLANDDAVPVLQQRQRYYS
jgi:hypothetical protein